MTPRSLAIAAVAGLGLFGRAAAADEPCPETPAHREARLAWWRQARFGMFLHWGPVSLKGTEIGWSRGGERRGYSYGPGKEVPAEVYDQLYKQFNPTAYDPEAWVKLARDAGMGYVVLTSRHHDGFSLFDTKASDYRITSAASPYRRDIVGALAQACHRAGMPFGLYYSQPDWHHPDAFTPDRHDRYVAYLKSQLIELLSNYGKVDYLFFDGLSSNDPKHAYGGSDLNVLARRLQPQILLNDRNGPPSDFDTPEQRIGGFQVDRPWESCMTLGTQWAWKPDDRIKSSSECIRVLARCAGGDGNLLLNVGPRPDGTIEPRQAEVLRGIGRWLGRHGESIYGTRGGPYRPAETVVSTRRGNHVYLLVLKPEQDVLTLPALPAGLRQAEGLHGEGVDVSTSENAWRLTVPRAGTDEAVRVVRLTLDRPAGPIPVVSVPGPGSER